MGSHGHVSEGMPTATPMLQDQPFVTGLTEYVLNAFAIISSSDALCSA